MHPLSPDLRVAGLAARYTQLRTEKDMIDGMLAAYAAAPDGVSATPMPPVAALRHYGMSDRSICGCDTCAEWRRRRDELVMALRFVPEGHRWSVCACAHCRFVGRIQLNYVAASNVRDLLIEISYHANFHSRHGTKVMVWFESELRSPRYTVDWCAYELGRRPVDEWLNRCETALSPVLSGAVFVPGDGEQEELSSWMSSQIGAVSATAPMMAA